MAVPKDVKKVLSNVSTALELPSSGRKELFDYWEDAFGAYFKNWESSSTSFRSLIREQTAVLAKQWAEAWLVREPSQAAMKSGQTFFEGMARLLTTMTSPEFSGYPFLYLPQEMASRFHETYQVVPYKVPLLGWVSRNDDEDEETRTILNQLSIALQGASEELAVSNEKIETTLAKMGSV